MLDHISLFRISLYWVGGLGRSPWPPPPLSTPVPTYICVFIVVIHVQVMANCVCICFPDRKGMKAVMRFLVEHGYNPPINQGRGEELNKRAHSRPQYRSFADQKQHQAVSLIRAVSVSQDTNPDQTLEILKLNPGYSLGKSFYVQVKSVQNLIIHVFGFKISDFFTNPRQHTVPVLYVVDPHCII